MSGKSVPKKLMMTIDDGVQLLQDRYRAKHDRELSYDAAWNVIEGRARQVGLREALREIAAMKL